jgi:HK97 family phage major capsid protein
MEAVKGFASRFTEVEKNYLGFTDRLEEIESKRNSPGLTAAGDTREGREHKRLFCEWLRKPYDGGRKQALGDFQSKLTKSINLGANADGAYAVPEEIARDIEKMEIKLSPVRNMVKVVRTSTGDFKSLVNIGGAASGWVGETDSRTETLTPQLRERAPSFGEIYAYPQVTEWAADDIFFNVADWLTSEVSEQFAYEEGAAVLTGDGTKKPTGMLHTSPVTTADGASPLRSADAYQYIGCPSVSSPAVAELVGDKLIDLVYSVNAKYRSGAAWAMNSTTAGAVRKLKDSNGQYLWQPSLQAGQPDRLLGYEVAVWEQMDDVGTNKFPIAFGNFNRGYILADRTDIRITVDNNITTPGKIKFFVRRREGGCVLNNDAIKWLKTTLS